LICERADRVRRTATRRSWRNSGSRSARVPDTFASRVSRRCRKIRCAASAAVRAGMSGTRIFDE